VNDARQALALAAHRYHDDPSAHMLLAGVTGTAGKTTTVYLLESILRCAGWKVGALGTVSYRYDGSEVPAPLTTPQSMDLAALLADMRQRGVQAVGMEVTSHALDQHRSTGCRFAAVAFTNLSREHLDYHRDMEDYYAAKRKLFTDYGVGDRGAVNVDDVYGRRLLREVGRPLLRYAVDEMADVRGRDIRFDDEGIGGWVDTPSGAFALRSSLLGPFNAMNVLAATSLALLLDAPLTAIGEGIAQLRQVPGRLENVGRAVGRRVIVDYSHKVEALQGVLALARTLTPRRIFTVFGCGGDRDRGKRPLMGSVAVEGSDCVVLTSDNPRSEDPMAILAAIEEGAIGAGGTRILPGDRVSRDGRSYLVIPDRREAIRWAIRAAGPSDTVMICGKGHEDYQLVGDERREFDDRRIAIDELGVLGDVSEEVGV
jgi:UDP-N-acetylmuramyl-tripeptide synthetase